VLRGSAGASSRAQPSGPRRARDAWREAPGTLRQAQGRLGRPCWFLGVYMGRVPYTRQVSRHERPSREAEDRRESDQSIVLGDGNAGHRGKGLTGSRSPQRKHKAGHGGPGTSVNLTEGNSGCRCGSEAVRRARCEKTARRDLCGGKGGNPLPYRDGGLGAFLSSAKQPCVFYLQISSDARL
jgi:hypothetical protein